uniref:C2H2-type domain-containing protein n=1 Tax=Meloidogyne javanica TaxID=6303 RepID=A0A915LU64_MELJA
ESPLDLSFKKEELPDLEHNNDDFEGIEQEFERDETKDEIPEIIKNNRRRKLSFGSEYPTQHFSEPSSPNHPEDKEEKSYQQIPEHFDNNKNENSSEEIIQTTKNGNFNKNSFGPSPAKIRRLNQNEHQNSQRDEITGLYICDICDKTFNKQSSLARHKYEHSGSFLIIKEQ